MKLKLCSYELAKLAKEKGFDWNYNKFYHKNQGGISLYWVSNSMHHNLITHKGSYPAASLELLSKWFRDVHEIWVEVSCADRNKFHWCVVYPSLTSNMLSDIYSDEYSISYEEAQEAALFKTFELI